jgi:elongation factor P--(R)-beta-lysine ligase
VGMWHRPEFLMLEWYRIGWTLDQLIDEVLHLITAVIGESKPVVFLSYRHAFERYGSCTWDTMTDQSWKEWAQQCGFSGEGDRTVHQQIVLTHVIEPQLKDITVLHEFPKEACALAKVQGEISQRFEIYLDDVEIANGFDELIDCVEQRRRFEGDQVLREKMGLPPIPMSEDFLLSLEHMPDSVGVAVGIDRLISKGVFGSRGLI